MRERNPREVWATLAIIVAACAIIGACQAFQTPESVDQRIAYAYGTHTAVMNAAAASVEQGAISADQGEDILAIADRALVILDGSRRALALGDLRQAETQLALALGVLGELQSYLRRAQQ